MAGLSILRWWPYRRASLMAASLASAPELPKTAVHAGHRSQGLAQLLLGLDPVQVGVCTSLSACSRMAAVTAGGRGPGH